MAALATAYVQIVPSMSGVGSAISKAFTSGQGAAAAKTAGQSTGETFSGGVKGALVKLGGVIAAAGIGKAFLDVGKQALKAYAVYEQAVGGVETLFKESAGTVEKYASTAYKTAGLSANDYMNTITSFAAAMTASLGGDVKKSAQISNMAVTDMADNANKMGTSMESIQMTYQSLSRGNYAMLDNLKLGYGGTKKELERLLQDAQKLTGQKYDISNFSDVVKAIHAVQTHLGITGTTAKEAATTIEGSVASMKAAWDNWLTGLGRSDVDLSSLSSQLVTSFTTVVKNVAPRILQIGKGLFTALPQVLAGLGPAIQQAFTDLFQGVKLPGGGGVLAQQATSMVDGFISRFSTLKTSLARLWENVSSVFTSNSMLDSVTTIVQSIVGVFDSMVDSTLSYWNRLVNAFSNMGFLQSASSMISGIASGIASAFQGVSAFIQPVISSIMSFAATLVESVTSSSQFQGLLSAIGSAFQTVGGLIASVLGPLGQWVSQVISFIAQSGVFQGAINMIAGALQALVAGFTLLVTGVQNVWNLIAPIVSQMVTLIINVLNQMITTISSIWNSILPIIQPVLTVISSVISATLGVISSVWGATWNTITTVVNIVWNSIQSQISAAMTVIKGVITVFTSLIRGDWSGVWNGIKQVFIGVWQGITASVTTALNLIRAVISGALNVIKALWSAVWHGLGGVLSAAWNGIKQGVSGGIHAVVGILSGLGGAVKNAVSGAGQWLMEAGKAVMNGFMSGIRNVWKGVQNFFGGIGNWIKAHKGPLSYDRRLLIPAGQAIMGGFYTSLESSFHQVQRFINQVAPTISGQLEDVTPPSSWVRPSYRHTASPITTEPTVTQVIQNFPATIIRQDEDLYTTYPQIYRTASNELRSLR